MWLCQWSLLVNLSLKFFIFLISKLLPHVSSVRGSPSLGHCCALCSILFSSLGGKSNLLPAMPMAIFNSESKEPKARTYEIVSTIKLTCHFPEGKESGPSVCLNIIHCVVM